MSVGGEITVANLITWGLILITFAFTLGMFKVRFESLEKKVDHHVTEDDAQFDKQDERIKVLELDMAVRNATAAQMRRPVRQAAGIESEGDAA